MGWLSGPATKKIMEREYEVYGHIEFGSIAQISAAHLYGSVHIVYRDRALIFTEIKELPRKHAVTPQKQLNPQPRRTHIPPPDHPWRRFSLKTRRISQELPV